MNLPNIKNALLILLIGMLFTTGCKREIFCVRGEGADITRTLELPEINGVKLAISGNVHLKQGAVQEVIVEGQENVIDALDLDFSGKVLKIGSKGCIGSHKKLDFYITIPDLVEVSVSGSGNISTDSAFTNLDFLEMHISGSGNMDVDAVANTVEMSISGSGDMNSTLTCTDLSARITGSGNVRLYGTCDSQNLDITGSGDLHSFGMPAQEVYCEISGSGNCEVDVAELLDVKISGSGSVTYRGNPIVNANISGSGNVRHNP